MIHGMSSPHPTKIQTWLMASRPKTLPAAVAPVIVGSAVAFAEGGFHLPAALAALSGALLLQIGANLANDYFDFFTGADAGERLGPVRVTQAGLVHPPEMRKAMWIVFGLAILIGIYLAWRGGWPIVAVGVLSILAAIAYTGGPYPLGYHGLGELFAFIFFGPVAVGGTAYVQSGRVSLLTVGASIAIGTLVVAILIVNNLRDIENDQRVGKRTLAVRIGVRATRAEYALMLGVAFFIPVVLVFLGVASAWILVSWGALVLTPRLAQVVFHQKGRSLNQALAGTGQLTLWFGLLLAVGMVLGSL